MYRFLHDLLSDKKGGEIFTLFGTWHFIYIALTLSAIIVFTILLRGKDIGIKTRTLKWMITAVFCLYIADFFLMPFAYGEIDIEKLPFHACTAMCVMCFLSYHIEFLKRYRTSLVLLGLVSNLVYLIYPAGVMWHAVHPISYRVIQTLTFHSLMTIYGFLTLFYEQHKFDGKSLRRNSIVIVCMTAWALLGNYTYNGTWEDSNRFFNWFFVVRDPFYTLSETVAPIVMPFLNFAIFFVAEILLQLAILGMKRRRDNI